MRSPLKRTALALSVSCSLLLYLLSVAGLAIGGEAAPRVAAPAWKAKNVVKEVAVFRFRFSDGAIVEIDGKLLVGRPEDRLKKSVKRLW